MFSFFKFKSKSKDEAKKRLTVILQYERQGIPPSLIENLRNDIMSVLSKYPQLEINNIDLAVKGDREQEISQIYISIPIKNL